MSDIVILLCALIVIDGHTLACNSERIRLWQVETPPALGRCVDEADAARVFLERVVAGATETPEMTRRGGDDDGHTLATVWIDGKSLGDLLITHGHGRDCGDRGCDWDCD